MNDWVEVEDKKELAELLISGGKWTNDEWLNPLYNGSCFEYTEQDYCFFSTDPLINAYEPFLLCRKGVYERMTCEWEIKKWRKL